MIDIPEITIYTIIGSALTDENGVNEETYNLIVSWAEKHDPEYAKILKSTVDATDGRFYLKKED